MQDTLERVGTSPKVETARLIRIVFASVAAAPRAGASGGDGGAAAGSPLEAGRSGITGLVVVVGRSIAAVMEGPEKRLIGWMETIAADRRHRGVEVLLEAPIAERRFLTWRLLRLTEAEAGSDAAPVLAKMLAERLGA